MANKARSFEEILDDKSIDAVHLVTPIPLHAKQTIDVFQSGKHCACTVPMATSIKDLLEILKAQKKSNKVYMGMETAVYTRHFIYVQVMVKYDNINGNDFKLINEQDPVFELMDGSVQLLNETGEWYPIFVNESHFD